MNLKYLKRFPGVPQTTYEDFAKGIISNIEWNKFHGLPKFTGYFNNLFELNDLSYFDELQQELTENGADFKNVFLRDIIIFELARRQIGIRNYSEFERVVGFSSVSMLYDLTNNPAYFIKASDISNVMRQIPPEKLMDFFLELVKEAIALGIIVPRILLGDGQFIHSNSNNNKPKNRSTYSDPDAGYCRHNGVKKGVGYDPWCLYAYCGPNRVFPVYFKMFPGNRNDNPACRETISEFIKLGVGEWKVFLADSGAYSKANLELIDSFGMIPVIRAKKNLKTQPTKELKKGYWFNTNYIPINWTYADFLKLYKIRPMVEKELSKNNTFYNASRMNTRGIDNAIRHKVLYYILDLLRALTGFKLGRPDLMCKLTAFGKMRDKDLSMISQDRIIKVMVEQMGEE